MSELHVIQSVPSMSLRDGGPSYTVSAGTAALRDCGGVDLTVLTKDEEPHLRVPLQAGIRLAATSGGYLHGRRTMQSLLRAAAGTVLVHDNGIWHPLNIAATGCAARSRVPYVISPHGMLEPWALRHGRVRKQVARWLFQDQLLRGAAGLVAASALELRGIRAAGLRNPVAVIPHGVETTIPSLLRTAPALPRTALFLSRLHPKKGLPHALEAWAQLRPAGWQLSIVGPGEAGYIAKLQAQIVSLQLDDVVRLHPAAAGSDKFQHFRNADLFLLPTYSENFGVVVAEALASGVPVITTVGTPWAQIEQAGCGWMIETGTQPLVAALQTAFALPDAALREMGERGRRWVTANFRWQENAQQHLEFYNWLLGRGAKPAFVDG